MTSKFGGRRRSGSQFHQVDRFESDCARLSCRPRISASMVRAAPINHVYHTSNSPALIYHSSLTGKCAANSLTEMNLDAPKDLLNLDVMHKRSTGKNVEAMTHGRFGTAPRGTRRNACAATHTTLSFSPHLTAPSNVHVQPFSATPRWRAQTARCRRGSSSTRTTLARATFGPRTF